MHNPIDLLPIPVPKDFDPSDEEPDYFYKNVVKPLIPDFIRIMNNYLTLDWKAVDELKVVIDNVLDNVSSTLGQNEIIEAFQEYQYPKKFAIYKDETLKSCRTIDHYLKEYDNDNMIHRTYLVNLWLENTGKLMDRKDKWSVKDLKAYNTYNYQPLFLDILTKKIDPTLPKAIEAMTELAEAKMTIWNKVREDKVDSITKDALIPPFNPGSSKQKQELFEYLKIEPLAFSKDTGLASWGRDQIEELFYTAEEENLKEVLQMFIDHSFSAIIKNNFLESFSGFAQDDRLYSNLKLFGAKTFRPTGNSPNLLQMPSTKSIYAKPLKKCFIAPEGYLVWTIDYSALEDRVIANLSGDINKISIFTEGLDGHSLNAVGYFPDKLVPILGENTDNVAYVKKFMAGVANGDKVLKKIRQEGKGPTFGLAYGAFPKKVASSIKCSLAAATVIFDNYHNVLYPGITEYREEYVLPTAIEQGYIHLGLGCRLYSDDAQKSIRTLNNATVQFWSLLTLLSINKLHTEIDLVEKQKDVVVTTTIYDSIYGVIKNDAESIKWLNETICPIMEKDFMEDQIVKNEANLEIGRNWADLTELEHNASIEDINKILQEI